MLSPLLLKRMLPTAADDNLWNVSVLWYCIYMSMAAWVYLNLLVKVCRKFYSICLLHILTSDLVYKSFLEFSGSNPPNSTALWLLVRKMICSVWEGSEKFIHKILRILNYKIWMEASAYHLFRWPLIHSLLKIINLK